MLKRKIEQQLLEWKNTKNHNPLIVKGCRQCGKTYSVLKFANDNYQTVVYLNFFQHKEYTSIFSDSLDVNYLTMMMSSVVDGNIKFETGKTIIVLDEIQECPQARTALKFFKLDGRYDVIGTGSLLGISGYKEQIASVPVGYESQIQMYPLDFEEFLWANGVTEDVISLLQNYLVAEKPVPEALHTKLNSLLLQYTVVGGMPDVVQTFIDTKQINSVLQIQRNIVKSYADDMAKYADKKDKALIRSCFLSIPQQLRKENKKFQYSLIQKGATASKFAGSLQWIEDAGIIVLCKNLNITELPLDGNVNNDVFKVYMVDTGLFVSMLEDGTQFDILNGNLLGYKGAIFENLFADILSKMGRKLYYYHKDSGLEIDFVMRYKGECTLVEVKASTGNTKSSKTILNHPEKYNVHSLIKLGGGYNIGRNENILTLPLYMGFLLREY